MVVLNKSLQERMRKASLRCSNIRVEEPLCADWSMVTRQGPKGQV